MAQSKSTAKKTTSKAKSSASTKKRSARPEPMNPPEPVVPIRRELGGVFFLFLTLVIIISYIPSTKENGAFVRFFSDLVSGFAGWGYYISAPIFLAISYILCVSDPNLGGRNCEPL